MDAPYWKWADIPVEGIGKKLEALGIDPEFYYGRSQPMPTPEEIEAYPSDVRSTHPWRNRWFKFKMWIRRMFRRNA